MPASGRSARRQSCRSKEEETSYAQSLNSSLFCSRFLIGYIEFMNGLLRTLDNLQDINGLGFNGDSFPIFHDNSGRLRHRHQLVEACGMHLRRLGISSITQHKLDHALGSSKLYFMRVLG